MKVLLVFIDGLGIGKNDPRVNPCADESLHVLNITTDTRFRGDLPRDGIMVPLDATLGVNGLPQSATGQTALLTGVNAAQVLGYHKQGFPNKRLRDVLKEKSILKVISERGKTAAFLNAFRPMFFEYRTEEIISKMSVTTVANWAAGLPFFSLRDVTDGTAIYQDFTNLDLVQRGFPMDRYSPGEAAAILARASRHYDFCLYEYFQTDHAGHTMDRNRIRNEVHKLDEFLSALITHMDFESSHLLVTSDHGNIEDSSVKTHTRNPVPALLWGKTAATHAGTLHGLTDVAPFILRVLEETPSRFENEIEMIYGSKLQFFHGKEVIPCQ